MSGKEKVSPLWRDEDFQIIDKDFRMEFQTPIPVCRYMVGLLDKNKRRVLEPSKGMGNMIRCLEERDKIVIAPDDFFLLDKMQRFDAVVMNPPFSTRHAIMDNAPANFQQVGMRMGYWFLTECMKMSDNVVALMPWFTISDSDLRLRKLKQYGIKSITGLPRKTFKYARIQTIVLELEKGYSGSTEFKTFDF